MTEVAEVVKTFVRHALRAWATGSRHVLACQRDALATGVCGSYSFPGSALGTSCLRGSASHTQRRSLARERSPSLRLSPSRARERCLDELRSGRSQNRV